MRRATTGTLVYSPSDLITFLGSPFASWMDRHRLEHRDELTPDPPSDEDKLIQDSGLAHERTVLAGLIAARVDLAAIDAENFHKAHLETVAALQANRQVVYQAALERDAFQGYADFIQLRADGKYSVWDTKLARAPKPYFLVQLCAYSEMLEVFTGYRPERCGVILGTRDRVEYLVEDFFHFYTRLKRRFLELQANYSGDLADRPEPEPRANHGRWASHAERYFEDTDHLVRVAGITRGQIKKLNRAGITTMNELAAASGKPVRKLPNDARDELVQQARLQVDTLARRAEDPEALPAYEVLPRSLAGLRVNGLTELPQPSRGDVFFDMEGYPLVPGGLEYLFGLVARDEPSGEQRFTAWWAHDRAEEKRAIEGFVDFVHERWLADPNMHVYHYAPYEVSAVRRLSTRHDTRQEEVDDLLRNGVFVDLYKVVRRALMVGEDSYSIKRLERLYRGKRSTEVATAVDSIVQYASWLASGEARTPDESPRLKAIEDYNEDDCRSTVELYEWLRGLAEEAGFDTASETGFGDDMVDGPTGEAGTDAGTDGEEAQVPRVNEAAELAEELRQRPEPVVTTLADLLDYHRREDKPKWWKIFDSVNSPLEELRDDASCIDLVTATGGPTPFKKSLLREYAFDPAQECKFLPDKLAYFTDAIGVAFNVQDVDLEAGKVALKITQKTLDFRRLEYPDAGSLILSDIIPTDPLKDSLLRLGSRARSGPDGLPVLVRNLLGATRPPGLPAQDGEAVLEAAERTVGLLDGHVLVIQGPPGTGKTFTASRVITELVQAGKKIGIASNSHKAINNLLAACGEAMAERGLAISGVKVGGDADEPLFEKFKGLEHTSKAKDAVGAYKGGIIGGSAWLFAREEWVEETLDYLFIDEAGQVPLANAVAMAPCTKNLVLLGDQMQLEQPVQGAHPGDANLSVLQYALKDAALSREDAPVFHAVVPEDVGLFLGTSRRMHPDVCRFISESIYEGRLDSHADCARQAIAVPEPVGPAMSRGIVFLPVEHEGNIQASEEEVQQAVEVLKQLLGLPYTDKHGATRALELEDFLFVAPYNAQVRALKTALPDGARVGSVDKFQGQEAPVCVLSMCSSVGEYGSRGLDFILDKNRLNVAISRAMCLAVVIGDPRTADTLPGSVEQMRLLNLYCKLVDGGGGAARAV